MESFGRLQERIEKPKVIPIYDTADIVAINNSLVSFLTSDLRCGNVIYDEHATAFTDASVEIRREPILITSWYSVSRELPEDVKRMINIYNIEIAKKAFSVAKVSLLRIKINNRLKQLLDTIGLTVAIRGEGRPQNVVREFFEESKINTSFADERSDAELYHFAAYLPQGIH